MLTKALQLQLISCNPTFLQYLKQVQVLFQFPKNHSLSDGKALSIICYGETNVGRKLTGNCASLLRQSWMDMIDNVASCLTDAFRILVMRNNKIMKTLMSNDEEFKGIFVI